MEVIPEQWFSVLQLLPKDFRKMLIGQISSTNHLVCTWRVEIKREKSIKKEGSNGERNRSSLNHICNHFQSIYTRTYILRLCRRQIYLDNSSPFLFDYLLKSILTVKSFIRAKFSNPLFTNSLYWAHWAWIQSYLEPRIQNAFLQLLLLRGFRKLVIPI